MSERPDRAGQSRQERRETSDRANEATPKKRPEAELEGLDLSVEEVDERIHPSETNVFDK